MNRREEDFEIRAGSVIIGDHSRSSPSNAASADRLRET